MMRLFDRVPANNLWPTANLDTGIVDPGACSLDGKSNLEVESANHWSGAAVDKDFTLLVAHFHYEVMFTCY